MFDKLPGNWVKRVQFGFSLLVGFMREFWSVEVSKVFQFLVNADMGNPISTHWTKGNTHKPRRTIFAQASILSVFRPSSLSKIAKPVVKSISIYVVYVMLRPLSMNVKPSQSVGHKVRKVNGDVAITKHCLGPSDMPNRATPRNSFYPSKYSGVWVIVKQFTQTLYGELRIVHSHAVSPVKKWFGQRPARVDSTGGLRYFSHSVLGNQA